MTTWRIPLANVDIGLEEKQAVLEVLDRGWLTMGEITAKFEEEFAQFIGVKYALAVSNCTVGLHMACLAAGIGKDDEVIVPSLSFVATANAVTYTGATPIFADVISDRDLTISPESIEEKITERTKAIIVMHYGGYPCMMDKIQALAERYQLVLIEDDAHAPGAELLGIRMGSWGKTGCFSFFGNKNLTTGEGGMVTANDETLVEKLRWLRSHGMTTLTWDRHRGHAWSYDVVAPGFNYRLDEIRSALGRVQLQKLPRNNQKRQHLVEQYKLVLTELVPEIVIPFENHPGHSAYHLMVIQLPEECRRDRFTAEMSSQGIQTSLHYPPIHRFSYYQRLVDSSKVNLPVTERAAAHLVTLPLYPSMTDSDVEQVALATRDAFRRSSFEK